MPQQTASLTWPTCVIRRVAAGALIAFCKFMGRGSRMRGEGVGGGCINLAEEGEPRTRLPHTCEAIALVVWRIPERVDTAEADAADSIVVFTS